MTSRTRTGDVVELELPARPEVVAVARLVVGALAAVEPMFGLPDSGDMPTVIAPDLSNLPPGETAINPETGEEFTKSPHV